MILSLWLITISFYFYKYYPADMIRGVVVWLVMVNSMDAISVSMYCKLMIFFCLQNAKMAKTTYDDFF